MRHLLVSALGCIVAAASFPALARAQCDEGARAWARACDAHWEAAQCEGARWTLRRTFDDALPLTIELRTPPGGSFRTVGDVGLSPIAELPDWSAAPRAWQDALEGVAACVARGTPFRAVSAARPEAPTAPPPPPSPPRALDRVPWRGLTGLALLAALLLERRRHQAPLVRRAWPAIALAAGTWALRALLVTPAFFHQNGHGPLWVDFALCVPTDYGPGYRELFGVSAEAAGASPEAGVFLAQSIALACLPALAFAIARAQGAPLSLSWVLAAGAALDPISARLSWSESYFGAPVVLLAAACAALVLGARRDRRRFVVAVLAAGLLVSQSARVHPLVWLAAATVPLVVLGARGLSPRTSIARAALAASGIGLVTAVTSGPTLWDVLAAQRAEWSTRASSFSLDGTLVVIAAVGLVVATLGARSRGRGALRGAGLALVLLPLARSAHLAAWTDAVAQAHARLYAPVLLALAAAVLAAAPLRARSAMAVSLAAALALVFVARFDAWTRLPTDALEENVALAWRARTTEDDLVVYVERAADHMQHLPFSACAPGHARALALHEGSEPPSFGRARGHLYYVETSVCSTPAGRALCRRAREGLRIRRLEERSLPALRSNPHQPFDVAPVPIWLGEIAR